MTHTATIPGTAPRSGRFRCGGRKGRFVKRCLRKMKQTNFPAMTSFTSAVAGNLPCKVTRSRVASVGIRRTRVPLSRTSMKGLK